MRINQIKETCLYVKNLEATRQFYQHKLGLELITEVENRHLFFRAGTSVLLCFNAEATKQDHVLPPHFGIGHLHLAFEVDHLEYEEWKEKIKSQNIPIIHEHEWKGGIKSFYFNDPDNHVLEIVPPGMWD
jgi:catechol 2,3-dioxygenase-like lactoylglutathione lyase family enzyme